MLNLTEIYSRSFATGGACILSRDEDSTLLAVRLRNDFVEDNRHILRELMANHGSLEFVPPDCVSCAMGKRPAPLPLPAPARPRPPPAAPSCWRRALAASAPRQLVAPLTGAVTFMLGAITSFYPHAENAATHASAPATAWTRPVPERERIITFEIERTLLAPGEPLVMDITVSFKRDCTLETTREIINDDKGDTIAVSHLRRFRPATAEPIKFHNRIDLPPLPTGQYRYRAANFCRYDDGSGEYYNNRDKFFWIVADAVR